MRPHIQWKEREQAVALAEQLRDTAAKGMEGAPVPAIGAIWGGLQILAAASVAILEWGVIPAALSAIEGALLLLRAVNAATEGDPDQCRGLTALALQSLLEGHVQMLGELKRLGEAGH